MHNGVGSPQAQQAAIDRYNRPVSDIRILRATIISDPFAPKPQPTKAVKAKQGKGSCK